MPKRPPILGPLELGEPVDHSGTPPPSPVIYGGKTDPPSYSDPPLYPPLSRNCFGTPFEELVTAVTRGALRDSAENSEQAHHTGIDRCGRRAQSRTAPDRRLTQHSLPGGSLGLTWAGLAPADRASFAWRLPLFDRLVCRRKQLRMNFEAERLGRLEIDRQFVLGRGLDRQIGGFSHLTRKLRGVQFDRFSNNRRPFGPTQTDPAARRTSLRRNMRRHSGAALGSEMP